MSSFVFNPLKVQTGYDRFQPAQTFHCMVDSEMFPLTEVLVQWLSCLPPSRASLCFSRVIRIAFFCSAWLSLIGNSFPPHSFFFGQTMPWFHCTWIVQKLFMKWFLDTQHVMLRKSGAVAYKIEHIFRWLLFFFAAPHSKRYKKYQKVSAWQVSHSESYPTTRRDIPLAWNTIHATHGFAKIRCNCL